MRQWAPELREEAVRHVRSTNDTINSASRQLGVPPSTLRRWLREDDSRRISWIPPTSPTEMVAHPRMVKVLATLASPRPQRRRGSLLVTVLLSAACVALGCGIAFDAASDDVTSSAGARGLAAVVLGATLGGLTAYLPDRLRPRHDAA